MFRDLKQSILPRGTSVLTGTAYCQRGLARENGELLALVFITRFWSAAAPLPTGWPKLCWLWRSGLSGADPSVHSFLCQKPHGLHGLAGKMCLFFSTGLLPSPIFPHCLVLQCPHFLPGSLPLFYLILPPPASSLPPLRFGRELVFREGGHESVRATC